MTPAQVILMSQALGRVKDAVARIGTEHRDLHSSVSKVGKAIDRVRTTLITELFCKPILGLLGTYLVSRTALSPFLGAT